MKIVVRAPLLSISGYGQHSRQIFEAIKRIPGAEVFTQIVQWGNTSWFVNPEAENGLVAEIMKRSTDQQSGFDFSFQVQLPDEWSTDLARVNVGITAAVETDVCNPVWVDRCNKMNAIIVPSAFTKQVLEKTGKIDSPIYVVPEWFIEEISQGCNQLDIPIRTDFNFLIVSQMTSADSSIDRKNISNTIKWICETFSNDKSVGIIIKTNCGRGTTIDRTLSINALQSVLKESRKNSRVPVYLLHGNMSNSEISSLYRHPKIKAFVSLTRGEGFGLPLLESAAAGIPVIATDWSAHTEFLNLGKWIKVESKLIQIPEQKVDGRIFVPGSSWADPSEDLFKKKIKKFRDSSTIPTQWAQELKQKCHEKYSKNSIFQIYDSVLKEILKNA